MKKRIAIPVNENGILDGHFGHCKFFALIDLEEGIVLTEDKVVPPPHEPGLLPKWLAEKGATDIIAGGMGQRAIDLFNQNNINVVVGAPKVPALELIEGFVKGTLEYTNNYCTH